MLSIVVFKWVKTGYRSTFRAEHVNVMRSMVERNYPDPHQVICITDDPRGIDSRVMCVPIWDTYGELKNPSWPDAGPSCYRRLRAFSRGFEEIAGARFVCIDLDMVLVGDMRPLWNRPEDFVIYSSHGHYNGSMWLMTAGARAQVWEGFDPVRSPQEAKEAGNFGSDQAWIQHCLGRSEAIWTDADGIYGYRKHCTRALPSGARAVVFHGQPDPWSLEAQYRSPWIKQHYQ